MKAAWNGGEESEGGEGALVLDFEGAEKEILFLSLTEIQEHYEADFEKLPQALKKYWSGTLSASADPELAEAAEDLRETRLAWRSDRLKALDRWLASDGVLADPDSHRLRLDPDEIDLFLAILNDRRLTLAILHGFDDPDMEVNPASIEDNDRQRALWEVHFLAFVMEHCLQGLQGQSGEE